MSQPALDLDLDDGADPTFRVGELADLVNQLFRRHLPDGVWVRGEVQGVQTRNGHTYFTLTDVDGEGRRATLQVVLFASIVARLRPLLRRHRLDLADGLAVRVHGHLDVYPPTGRLALKMDGLDPRYTLGELSVRRDEVARRLTAEGLLEANRRQPMPPVPLRVGLVTSVRSAAWHDVVDELGRSGYAFEVIAADARVQGDGAAAAIAYALHVVTRHEVDVVVLVRGGGSRSDLATFDAEQVARAIASCPVPVLTGLGHEIDRSLADEVAHTSYKTPTACAASLVSLVRSYLEATERAWVSVAKTADQRLRVEQTRLDGLTHRAARAPRVTIDVAQHRLAERARRLARGAGLAVAGETRHLDHLESRARSLDPGRTLARGWTITRDGRGRVVRRAGDVEVGSELITTFARGTARSRVEEAAP